MKIVVHITRWVASTYRLIWGRMNLKMGQNNNSIAEVMVDSQYLNVLSFLIYLASIYMSTATFFLSIWNLDHSFIYMLCIMRQSCESIFTLNLIFLGRISHIWIMNWCHHCHDSWYAGFWQEILAHEPPYLHKSILYDIISGCCSCISFNFTLFNLSFWVRFHLAFN